MPIPFKTDNILKSSSKQFAKERSETCFSFHVCISELPIVPSCKFHIFTKVGTLAKQVTECPHVLVQKPNWCNLKVWQFIYNSVAYVCGQMKIMNAPCKIRVCCKLKSLRGMIETCHINHRLTNPLATWRCFITLATTSHLMHSRGIKQPMNGLGSAVRMHVHHTATMLVSANTYQ